MEIMDELAYKNLAAQLCKPEGQDGLKTGEWMNKGNERMNLDAFDVLNASANESILELGMGNGAFVKNILSKDPTIKYTGCDFSETMIDAASVINKEWIEKGQAKFLFSDVNALPFSNQSFNKIFTVNTLYFWQDKSRILNEMKRVLKPCGRIIIAIRPKHQMEKYPFTKYGFSLFTKDEVIQLLTNNGFNIVKLKETIESDFELNGETIKMENIVFEAVVN